MACGSRIRIRASRVRIPRTQLLARIACSGSTRAARRAGTKQAISAISRPPTPTTVKASGSAGETLKSMLRAMRVTVSATATPIEESRNREAQAVGDHHAIDLSAAPRPIAMRTPISGTRSLTV